MIKIDGGFGSGSGQIIRYSLGLSALTKKEFEVTNIRLKRANTGLRPQHVSCISIMSKLCSATAIGNCVSSTELKFSPGKLNSENISFDIGTAGSITLVLQSIIMPLMFLNKKNTITITGGTDVKGSMSFDYFKEVVLPQLKKYCSYIDIKLLKRGYYPKGQGVIELTTKPKFKIKDFKSFNDFQNHVIDNAKNIDLTDKGKLSLIKGVSHASTDLQKNNVAERQAKTAEFILKQFNVPVSIRIEYQDTLSTGSGITLWAIFSKENSEVDPNNPIILGSDCLGEKGLKAENVGMRASENLVRLIKSEACVDKNLADNLILPLGLFLGKIKTEEMTDHIKAAIYVTESFIDKRYSVSCEDRIIEVKR